MNGSSPPSFARSLRTLLPAWAAAAIGLVSIAFVAFPEIDIATSRLFVNDQGVFASDHHRSFQLFSLGIAWLGRTIAALLILGLTVGAVASSRRFRVGRWLHAQRRSLAFLLIALAIGPGLLINLGLKEFTGRARPEHIVAFGGTQQFTPAFVIADQCERNCSFVSGDVAAATMLVAGFFIARSRRTRRAWLIAGLVCAAMVGAARIVSGHHFLSDVVIAAALTYLTTALCAAWLLPAARPDTGQ